MLLVRLLDKMNRAQKVGWFRRSNDVQSFHLFQPVTKEDRFRSGQLPGWYLDQRVGMDRLMDGQDIRPGCTHGDYGRTLIQKVVSRLGKLWNWWLMEASYVHMLEHIEFCL